MTHIQDEAEMAKIRQWLAMATDQMPSPVPPTEGTCDWMLEHPCFQSWVDGEKSQLLWVQGLPGRGKSVMAGFLHEHLLAQGCRTMFHRFQHSAASATHSTPTTAAASLIYQLLERSPTAETSSAIGKLITLTSRFPMGPHRCTFEQLWGMVEVMLASQPDWTLVVDAFDECTFDGPSVPEASAFIKCLQNVTEETQTRILIFSRPDPRFDASIKSNLFIYLDDHLLLHDVMAFSEAEYQRLDLPESQRMSVMERVRSSSQGSFWWVRLFLDYLSRSLEMSEFHERLQSLAPSISNFYEAALLHPTPRLDDKETECRNAIFLLDFKSQRTLTVSEMGDALSLRPDKAEAIISRLCQPLISTRGGLFQLSHPSVREYFESCNQIPGTSLNFSFSDSHALLATKCLSALLDQAYANLESVTNYLKAASDRTHPVDVHMRPNDSGFYSYASRYWHYHLTQVKSPQAGLVQQTNEFLHSLNFIFWIHYCDLVFGRRMGVVGALERIKSWCGQLPTDDQRNIQIDDCYTSSYHILITSLRSSNSDLLSQLLAQLNLCNHSLNLGLFEKDSAIRERVVSQLRDLLGQRHPIVLRARAGIAYSRLLEGKMRAAHRMYSELADVQRELVGEDDVRFVEALHYRGEGEYYMSDFAAAAITFTVTSTGFLRIFGPDRWSYLAAQVWYASAMAHLDQIDLSLKIFQSLFQKRREDFGPVDSLTITIQIAMADILRAMGRSDEAIGHLREVLDLRRGSCSPSDIYRLDVEISLARTFHEAGLIHEARGLVQELEEGGGLTTHFERYCQVTHLKALILATDGSSDEAINVLQEILIQAEPDQNNRALMWARLDLAAMLRQRDGEGDACQANSVFDNLVKDVSGDYEPGFPNEPDPPRLLAAAENALAFLRSRKHAEAKQVLDEGQLEWLRPSDLWLWVTEAVFV
ncbi:hypothetical protein BHE90_011776 [Fusarium euwallaceae]|uniref:Nephrocystin 3-like N-terminal domain-containing protein n=2 Tax=Fusarium solani species complex TaxID=232080 RepID=A0A430LDJ7_9HYPO|nr:hypothetical protein BHE90_011776 [Fusarium euwallaceae]